MAWISQVFCPRLHVFEQARFAFLAKLIDVSLHFGHVTYQAFGLVGIQIIHAEVISIFPGLQQNLWGKWGKDSARHG